MATPDSKTGIGMGRWIGQTQEALMAIPRTAVMSIIGPAALLVLGYLFWNIWGAQALDRTYYSVQLDNIKVTPQPAWIRTSVVEEVFKGSFLKEVSLLDRNAASTIAHAFDLHPWVKRTTRVTKHPNGEVIVDLEYRQPIALVALDPSNPIEKRRAEERAKIAAAQGGSYNELMDPGRWKFIPVDGEGVILPSKEPESYRISDYLHVYAKDSSTNSHVGHPFGDSRIHDGVKLCGLLNPLRRELNIEGVYVHEIMLPSGKKDFLLEVSKLSAEGKDARRITWGHAPGSEAPGEMDLKTKLQKLYQHFSAEDGQLTSQAKTLDVSGLRY